MFVASCQGPVSGLCMCHAHSVCRELTSAACSCLQSGRAYLADDVKRCFRDLLGAGLIESAGVSEVLPGGTACCWLRLVHSVSSWLSSIPGRCQCRTPAPAARGFRAPRHWQNTLSPAQAASDGCHLSHTLPAAIRLCSQFEALERKELSDALLCGSQLDTLWCQTSSAPALAMGRAWLCCPADCGREQR